MVADTPASVCGRSAASGAEPVVFARFWPRITIIAPGGRLLSSSSDAPLTTRILPVSACKTCQLKNTSDAIFFTVGSLESVVWRSRDRPHEGMQSRIHNMPLDAPQRNVIQ